MAICDAFSKSDRQKWRGKVPCFSNSLGWKIPKLQQGMQRFIKMHFSGA
jgi:hypothetical protein